MLSKQEGAADLASTPDGAAKDKGREVVIRLVVPLAIFKWLIPLGLLVLAGFFCWYSVQQTSVADAATCGVLTGFFLSGAMWIAHNWQRE